MDSGVGNQVGLELSQVHVQGSVKSAKNKIKTYNWPNLYAVFLKGLSYEIDLENVDESW